MIAPRGTNILELDHHASMDDQPHLIVTADCSNPKELDDGLLVEPLPSAQEMYRVSVCVVDTSPLYREAGVLSEVMNRTEAKYYQLEGDESGYQPMVSEEIIEDMDFRLRRPGDTRGAMVVRFVIGRDQPPTDTEVVFGQVEVAANHDYHDFALQASEGGRYEKYGRAALFIKNHLAFTSGGDYDNPDNKAKPVLDPIHQGFIRGSRLNEAAMVGACNQVGQLLTAEEDRIAIYRIHDPADEAHRMFLPANVATYSWDPGPHDGLGLYGYCRVTSPLRRGEDFIMSHLLKQRYEGQSVTRDEEDTVALAVHRLNARIMHEYASKPIKHIKGQALLGRNRRMLGGVARSGANVLSMQHPASDTAIV